MEPGRARRSREELLRFMGELIVATSEPDWNQKLRESRKALLKLVLQALVCLGLVGVGFLGLYLVRGIERLGYALVPPVGALTLYLWWLLQWKIPQALIDLLHAWLSKHRKTRRSQSEFRKLALAVLLWMLVGPMLIALLIAKLR